MISNRIWLICASLAAVLVLGFGIAWKLKADALMWERLLRVAAEQKSDLATQTLTITVKQAKQEAAIKEQAEASVDEIQSQPGADAPVPDELLSSWGRSIDGLRNNSQGPGDRGSANAAGGVSASAP